MRRGLAAVILGAGVLLGLLILAALWPGRAAAGELVSAVRNGCQASLIALLIANLTFPTFQGTQITYVMGFLVAYCAIPVVAARRMPVARRAAMHDDRAAVSVHPFHARISAWVRR